MFSIVVHPSVHTVNRNVFGSIVLLPSAHTSNCHAIGSLHYVTCYSVKDVYILALLVPWNSAA